VGNHFYLPEGKSEEALFKRVPFLHRVSELLSLSLMHLNGSIKCKVIDYKHENYRVQVFTKENRLIMPIQITDSSRMRSSSPTAGTSFLNRLRKDSIIFLLYFLVAALWTAFTILPTNLDSFTSWTLLADSNFNAPMGHMRAQAGSRPASTLSIHRLHFCIFSS
jgi:hypothetical protein